MFSHSLFLRQVLRDNLLLVRRQTLRDEASNGAVVACVGISHVLLDPCRNVLNVREVVTSGSLARVERRKRHAKANVVKRLLCNNVITNASSNNRGVSQQRQQNTARVAPTLGKLGGEHLRVAQSLCQRDACRLAVHGTGKLLCLSQDKRRVHLSKGALVELIRVLNKKVGTVASLNASSNQVEEACKADLE